MDNTPANADSENVSSEPEDGDNTTVETELGDKDSVEPIGDCDYDGGKFQIRHCWLVFRDDHECKYALCMPCYCQSVTRETFSRVSEVGHPSVKEGHLQKEMF